MSVRPLYQRTPSHLDLLDPKEKAVKVLRMWAHYD